MSTNTNHADSLDEELALIPTMTAVDMTKVTERVQQDIEMAKIANMRASAIASVSWGKNMTSGVRRAIADYCAQFDVDPITEIDLLGGSLYINGDWYRRKLGELRRLGVVREHTLRHVHLDTRLQTLYRDDEAPQDLREQARRTHFENQLFRSQYNIPEAATGACICTIYPASGGEGIVGVKYGGGGTSVKQARQGGGYAPNPIVENNAGLSVETQSIRRAMIQFYNPKDAGAALGGLDRMESALEELNARVGKIADVQNAGSDFLAEKRAAELEADKNRPDGRLLGTGAYGAPMPVINEQNYTGNERDAVEIPRLSTQQVSRSAAQPDAFGASDVLKPNYTNREMEIAENAKLLAESGREVPPNMIADPVFEATKGEPVGQVTDGRVTFGTESNAMAMDPQDNPPPPEREPGDEEDSYSDLDLLSPQERKEYEEQRKLRGE